MPQGPRVCIYTVAVVPTCHRGHVFVYIYTVAVVPTCHRGHVFVFKYTVAGVTDLRRDTFHHLSFIQANLHTFHVSYQQPE